MLSSHTQDLLNLTINLQYVVVSNSLAREHLSVTLKSFKK